MSVKLGEVHSDLFYPFYLKNTGMYCNLDPDTEFFLNSKGEPFKLKKNAQDNYQPYSSESTLREFIKQNKFTYCKPLSSALWFT